MIHPRKKEKRKKMSSIVNCVSFSEKIANFTIFNFYFVGRGGGEEMILENIKKMGNYKIYPKILRKCVLKCKIVFLSAPKEKRKIRRACFRK